MVSIFLAMVMILSSNLVPGEQISYVHAEETAPASNQISAEPAKVYINNYTGNDRVYDFNENWKFDLGNTTEDPSFVNFDDAAWRDINLPHDFSIEQPFSGNKTECESGFLPGGTGWYRKTFKIDKDWQNKRISIHFDGVYMDSYIYLNGHKLGEHHYGYTPFSFELPSEYLYYGEDNLISVKAVNTISSSRWYSGSGIYRDVTLVVTNKLHVAKNGVTIITPNIGTEVEDKGKVVVKVKVSNDAAFDSDDIQVKTTISRRGNSDVVMDTKTVSNIASGQSEEIVLNLTVNEPKLWNVWDALEVTPDGNREQNIYEVKTEILKDDIVIDSVENTFGFRYFAWSNETGFSLNGRKMKLQGVCMHHDQGALGAEAWYDAIERQVDTLIDMGVNSIRVTHNPAAQALIDICDEKGILLIEEAYDTWTSAKNGNGNDYGKWFNATIGADNKIEGGVAGSPWSKFDTEAMVARGKNAPSIFMWSLGNELMEGGPNGNGYGTIASTLIEYIEAIDTLNSGSNPSGRWITFGDNHLKHSNANSRAIADAITEKGGIVGYNYTTNDIMNDRSGGTGRANWLIYGSETASAVNSRGAYNPSDTLRERSAYDTSAVGWGAYASEAWLRTIKWDRNAGEYVWTGFDYIGEPTPWNGAAWSEDAPKSSYFGIVETTGFPKDSYYLYRSVWNKNSHTLHILPSWDREDLRFDNNQKVDVVVYTDAYQAELWLKPANGSAEKKIGDKLIMRDVTSVAGNLAPNSTTRNGIYTYKMLGGEDNSNTKMYFSWKVPYEAGTLYAKIFDEKGEEITDTSAYVGRKSVTTTETNNRKLSVSANKSVINADGTSLSYVTIDVNDSKGNLVNSSNQEIRLSISGPGKIIGTDNGMQKDHASYQSLIRNAYHGKLLAIVQSTKESGEITVTATSTDSRITTGKVTITSVPVENDSKNKSISAVEYSKIHYLQKGTELKLPSVIHGYYSDGEKTVMDVSWQLEHFDNNKTNETQTIAGIARSRESSEESSSDVKISALVTVLDPNEVATLLNYSTAVVRGQGNVNLPSTRPVVMTNGNILDVSFAVEWDASSLNTDKEGIYVLYGTSSLFGKEFALTASVRVEDEQLEYLGNVADAAAKILINQEEENRVDEFSYLVDGNSSKTSDSWNVESGSVRFMYDTFRNVNAVTLAMKDAAPQSGSVNIAWSSDSTTFMELPAKVENLSNQNGITVRKYTFDMVPAIGIKISFDQAVNLTEVGISSVNLHHGMGTEAKLADIAIAGKPLGEAEINRGVYGYNGTDLNINSDIHAQGMKNASLTILPKYSEDDVDVVRILIESEDNNKRGSFVIKLNSASSTAMDPTDDSFDYPYNKTTASAPSYQNGEEASKAIDGDDTSKWHTAWQTNLGNTPEQRYIQISMEEAQRVVALRCLMRVDGNKNGRITQYEVYGSDAEVTPEEKADWELLSAGNWSNDSEGWKLASFSNGATTIKHIRLYGVTTIADSGTNKFVSAREIRIVLDAEELFNVADLSFDLDTVLTEEEGVATAEYTGEAIQPKVKVTLKDETATVLQQDQDYIVKYMSNVNPGNSAVVQVEGKGKYSGILRKYFTIKERVLKVEQYAPIEVLTTEGTAPILPGTVTAVLTGGSTKILDVVWQEIPESSYAKTGMFYVLGKVEGADLLASAKVVVTGTNQTGTGRIESISTVTLRGNIPDLPGTITVYDVDGTPTQKAVEWNISEEQFNVDAGAIVTVEGTIDGLEGKAAVATVRIEEPKEDNYSVVSSNPNSSETNLSLPMAIASYYGNADQPKNAINNDLDYKTSGNKVIWGDWQKNTYHPNLWLGVILGSNDTPADYIVNKVKVVFYDEKIKNAGIGDKRITFPEDYHIEYYVGPKDYTYSYSRVNEYSENHPFKEDNNWVEVSYKNEKPKIPAYEDEDWSVDVSFDPVMTQLIRIRMDINENWSGLQEFDAYGYAVNYNTEAALSQLYINSEPVEADFDENGIFIYEVQDTESPVPVIDASAINNGSVSIEQPKDLNGDAYIYITSEDGRTTNKYTVRLSAAKYISIGELRFNTEPVRGGRYDVNIPVIDSNKTIQRSGYRIKTTTGEYENLDITSTIVSQEYAGGKIVFFVEDSEGVEYLSEELSITLQPFVAVENIILQSVVNGKETTLDPFQVNTIAIGQEIELKASVSNANASLKNIELEKIYDETESTVYAWRKGNYRFVSAKPGSFIVKAYVNNGMADGSQFIKEFHFRAANTINPDEEDAPTTEFEPVIKDSYRDDEESSEGDKISTLDYYYTGEAITPVTDVWDNGVKLVAGVDYTVSYKNNKNAWVDKSQDRFADITGTYDAGKNNSKRPAILITGKGNYTKKQTIYFNIIPQDITSLVSERAKILVKVRGKTPTPVIYNKGNKLVVGKDFDFKDGEVKGKGNYTGIIQYNVVEAGSLKDMSKLSIVIKASGLRYEGTSVELSSDQLIVKDGNKVLTKGENADYTVEYIGNDRAGKATVIVSAAENSVDYVGSVSKTFTIAGKDLSKEIFKNVKLGEETFQGSDYPITIRNMSQSNKELLQKTIQYGTDPEISLAEGKEGHYIASYKNNAKVGTATVTLAGTGKDGVTGKVSLKYTIVSNKEEDAVKAEIEEADSTAIPYRKGGAKPKVKVVYTNKFGKEIKLTNGVDYTVAYNKPENAKDKIKTTGNTKAEITFKGNYKALPKRYVSYTIVPADLSDTIMVVADLEEGKKVNTAPKTVLTDRDGKNLTVKTDYILKYSINGKDFESVFQKIDTLNKQEYKGKIQVKAEAVPGGAYKGSKVFVVNIGDKGKNLSAAKVTTYKKDYTGQPIYLSISEADNLLKNKSDNTYIPFIGNTDSNKAIEGIAENETRDGYYILSYRDNQSKGKMTLVLRGNGKYYGSRTITITIGAKTMEKMSQPNRITEVINSLFDLFK